MRKEVKEVLGFQEIRKDWIYLGNSLVMSRNKTREFKNLKDRIVSRLSGWNRNILSKAGKATLIKSVIQAILIYTMSTFKVCYELDAKVRKFWWGTNPNSGRYMAFKSWKEVCKPK